jgi:MFS transporter, DHA1 family, multidrug resistance protein
MHPERVLTTVCCITFVVMLGIGIVIPLLPSYAQNMGATATEIGLIFSSFALARAVSTPFAGAIADRMNMKPMMLLGLLAYTLLSFTYVIATRPFHLVMIRALHGMASAFVIPLALTYAANISREGEEGLFMGSINMALFFGMGAGPLIGGFITDKLGLNAAFYCLSGLSGLAMITAVFFLPSMRKFYSKERPAVLTGILKDPVMLGLLLFRIINALGSGSLMVFIPLLAKGYGLTSTWIGILISSNIFLTGILQRPIGKISKKENSIFMIISGSIISAVTLLCLPFGKGVAVYLLLSCIMGFGSAVAMPAASVLLVEHGKQAGMSTTMGIFDTAMSVGMIIGPLLSGVIMDYMGIAWVFYAGGIICLAGTSVFWLLARTGNVQAHPC